MGWIGLHRGEHQDPHCTLAWWPKEQRIRDGVVFRRFITEEHSFGFTEASVLVVGTDKFGPKKDKDVILLDERSAALVHIRRFARQFDEGWGSRIWRPHVTLPDGALERAVVIPHMLVFTHIGVHTSEKALDGKISWKHTYRRLS